MRVDVWKRLVDRFHTSVLEFYATTEGSAVLANVTGTKVGSLGQPLPGTSEVALVAYDFAEQSLVRSSEGRLVRCTVDQPGVLVARIDDSHPIANAEDDVDASRRIVRDVFEPGDAWFVSYDVLRMDSDGDYWFVDRALDLVLTPLGPVSTVAVEDALYELPEIAQVVALGVVGPTGPGELPVAALVMRPGYALDLAALSAHVNRRLDGHARPRYLRVVEEIPLNVGYRPVKQALREGFFGGSSGYYRYDLELGVYEAEGRG
jgi:acyl-CoA synthetase (AMP-forming)/AMP-acid ligase II